MMRLLIFYHEIQSRNINPSLHDVPTLITGLGNGS